jgi:hypothetical protein
MSAEADFESDWQPRKTAGGHTSKAMCAVSPVFRACRLKACVKPAQGNALGVELWEDNALKGRNIFVPPFQGLRPDGSLPGALPQAFMFCSFGATERESQAVFKSIFGKVAPDRMRRIPNKSQTLPTSL